MRSLVVGMLCTVVFGCAAPIEPLPIEPTYTNVEAVLQRSCTFGSGCHGGRGVGNARLNFGRPIADGEPLTSVLVDVPACEFDAWPRVAPYEPERSWLMLKIDGPLDANGDIDFEPPADWIPNLTDGCPVVDGNGERTFGRRMPREEHGVQASLTVQEIELVRSWIALGAPGVPPT